MCDECAEAAEDLQVKLDRAKEEIAVLQQHNEELIACAREAHAIYEDLLAMRTVTDGRLRNARNFAHRVGKL